METETKKRKLPNIDVYEEEEEDEEVKIEKFFALIRSAKDIRDQLLDSQETRPPVTTGNATTKPEKTVAKTDKTVAKQDKAVAKVDKSVAKSHRKEKSSKDSQNDVVANADVMMINQSSTPAVASASGGGGGGSGGGKISSSSASEEEKGSKKSADCKKNYQESRIFLDLNLSL